MKSGEEENILRGASSSKQNKSFFLSMFLGNFCILLHVWWPNEQHLVPEITQMLFGIFFLWCKKSKKSSIRFTISIKVMCPTRGCWKVTVDPTMQVWCDIPP